MQEAEIRNTGYLKWDIQTPEVICFCTSLMHFLMSLAYKDLMSMNTPFFISELKFSYDKHSVDKVETKIYCHFYLRGIALSSHLIAGPREARNPNLDSDQRIAYYACAPTQRSNAKIQRHFRFSPPRTS